MLLENLNIYKLIKELIGVSLVIVQGMPKTIQVIIGDRFVQHLLDSSEYLSLASDSDTYQERLEYVDLISKELTKLKILVDIISDLRDIHNSYLISTKDKADLIEKHMSLLNQVNLWKSNISKEIQ